MTRNARCKIQTRLISVVQWRVVLFQPALLNRETWSMNGNKQRKLTENTSIDVRTVWVAKPARSWNALQNQSQQHKPIVYKTDKTAKQNTTCALTLLYTSTQKPHFRKYRFTAKTLVPKKVSIIRLHWQAPIYYRAILNIENNTKQPWLCGRAKRKT